MSESSPSSPSSADSFDNSFCPCGTFDVVGTGSPAVSPGLNSKEERKAPANVPSVERPLKYSTNQCKLLVRDVTDPANPRRIYVNSLEPHEVENDLFKGKLIFKARTHPVEPQMASYFEHYPKVQFEIQLQGKFKRRNRGVMYVGGELRAHTAPSFFRRGLVAVLLKILHSFNKKLQYSLGDPSPDHPQPNVEWFHKLADQQAPPQARSAGTDYDPAKAVGPSDAPHPSPGFLSFPLAPGTDRLIVTPPGQEPPALGLDMWPQDHPGCADKKTADPAWSFDTDNTYSLSFFSQNADLSRWKIVNLPGLGEMDLKDYWGTSPMRIVVYELKPDSLPDGDGVVSDDAETPHDHKHRNYLLALEISNPALFDA